MKEKIHIEGMSCTACSASIERVTRKLNGVISSNVNLIAKTLYIEYDESLLNKDDIFDVIKKAGFIPSTYDNKTKIDKIYNTKIYKETNVGPSIKSRLIVSSIFMILLMYVSMGDMVKLPLPRLLSMPFIKAIIEMLLALVVIIVNRKFYINGFKALIHKAPNMDTLVGMGSFISFVYGFALTILILIDKDNSNKYISNLYFDSSAMILSLITIGKALEEKAKSKTNSLVDSLKELAPKDVLVKRNNKEERIDIDLVKINDLFIVKEGETIPLDGIIVEGSSLIDESTITGESLPVYKKEGDFVLSSSINTNGYLIIKVTETSSTSIVQKMIDRINEAGATKANLERLADKISYYFVPIIMSISLITFIIWIILSKNFESSIAHAIEVLVVSCPCALGLATPVAITASLGASAKEGILIKDALSFEILNKVDTFVFDKTGTLTNGVPNIKEVISYDIKEDELIKVFKSLELKSSHPISKSIETYREDIKEDKVTNFESIAGMGLKGIINKKEVLLGNEKLLENNNIIVNKVNKTGIIIYVSIDSVHKGTIILDDSIRDESIEIIEYLKSENKDVAILSGDNYDSTIKIRDELGIDVAYDSVSPLDKERIIKEVKESGRVVAFIGDGINDSVALNSSSIGLSISGAKGIALDSSKVIFLKGNLKDIPNLIKISKRTVRIIKENLFWAFFYNILMIPIAAGVFSFLGISLSPMLCSLSMSISSLIVVFNALRLRRVK